MTGATFGTQATSPIVVLRATAEHEVYQYAGDTTHAAFSDWWTRVSPDLGPLTADVTASVQWLDERHLISVGPWLTCGDCDRREILPNVHGVAELDKFRTAGFSHPAPLVVTR